MRKLGVRDLNWWTSFMVDMSPVPRPPLTCAHTTSALNVAKETRGLCLCLSTPPAQPSPVQPSQPSPAQPSQRDNPEIIFHIHAAHGSLSHNQCALVQLIIDRIRCSKYLQCHNNNIFHVFNNNSKWKMKSVLYSPNVIQENNNLDIFILPEAFYIRQ